MIDLIASVTPAPIKGAPAPANGPGAEAFLTTLSNFLDAAADASPEPGTAAAALPGLPGKRQGLAEGGKDLPVADADKDASDDLIWLPTGMIVAPPVVTTPTMAASGIGGPAVAPPAIALAPTDPAIVPAAIIPAQAGVQLGNGGDLSTGQPGATPASAGAQIVAGENASKPRPTNPIDGLVAQPDAKQADTPHIRVEPAVPQPAQLQAAAPGTQPAGQVFAAAIASAVAAQARPHEREAPDARTPLAIAAATLEATHAPVVHATADARQSALDLRQDSGLHGMIDHIEMLRDNADANDTRIRLVPDALGAVDVSVRKDGDRVHVHFNAENQASARLLADAQPRLAELAEARGVKLGQTSVDSGAGGNARQHQPTTPGISTAPASARDILETTDSRIA